MDLETLIGQECLPRRDCMLVLREQNGESGFLYFKDAHLIEANCGPWWAKDALARMAAWQLAQHQVEPLPLGIKRSLWEPFETLLQEARSKASGGLSDTARKIFSSLPPQGFAFAEEKVSSESLGPWEPYARIPGVEHVVYFEPGRPQATVASFPTDAEPEALAACEQFCKGAAALGETLGMGRLETWSWMTDQAHFLGFPRQQGWLVLQSSATAPVAGIQAACRGLSSPS